MIIRLVARSWIGGGSVGELRHLKPSCKPGEALKSFHVGNPIKTIEHFNIIAVHHCISCCIPVGSAKKNIKNLRNGHSQKISRISGKYAPNMTLLNQQCPFGKNIQGPVTRRPSIIIIHHLHLVISG